MLAEVSTLRPDIVVLGSEVLPASSMSSSAEHGRPVTPLLPSGRGGLYPSGHATRGGSPIPDDHPPPHSLAGSHHGSGHGHGLEETWGQVLRGAGAMRAGSTGSGSTTHHGVGEGAAMSVALNLARNITDTPLLIVKPSSAGELFKGTDAQRIPPLNVMLEVATNAGHLLEWLLLHMTAQRVDRLLLAKHHGLDENGNETAQATRLMSTFTADAHSSGLGRLSVTKRVMAEGPCEGFPRLISEDRVDLLAIMAPTAKVTPPEVLDMVANLRTSVLVWRQPRSDCSLL
eukprot:gene12172-15290_t